MQRQLGVLLDKNVALEEMRFESLPEHGSGLSGVNVNMEAVPDCGDHEGEGSSSESLSAEQSTGSSVVQPLNWSLICMATGCRHVPGDMHVCRH